MRPKFYYYFIWVYSESDPDIIYDPEFNLSNYGYITTIVRSDEIISESDWHIIGVL